ncbi:MAG: hypothetical protein JW706_09550 [Opitutales bacterium]|nr:hypothetical protein [Opitutales bacterium]
MPSIPNTTDASAKPTAYEFSEKTTRDVKKVLGQEDFLKLLTVQLQHQDPMSPMSDLDFIASMSSFSSLEAMTDLSSNFETFTSGQGEMNSSSLEVLTQLASSMQKSQETQDMLTAQSYLGKTVTIEDEVYGSFAGVVDRVEVVEKVDATGKASRQVALVIEDELYPLSSVSGIEEAPEAYSFIGNAVSAVTDALLE